MSTAASKLRTLKIIDQLSMKDSCDVTSNKIFQATLCHVSWHSALSLSFPFSSPILSPWVIGRTISPRHASSIREHCPSSLNMSLSSMELMSPLWSSQIRLKNRHKATGSMSPCIYQILPTPTVSWNQEMHGNGLCDYSLWERFAETSCPERVHILILIEIHKGSWSSMCGHGMVNLKIIHPSIRNSFKCQQNTSQPSLVYTWPFAVLVELVKRLLDSCYLLPKESQQWEHHSEAGSTTSRLDS